MLRDAWLDTNIALVEVFLALLLIICTIQIFFIIFQHQIQDFFSKARKVKRKNKTPEQVKLFINDLASVLAKLSYDKVGAIIVVENNDNLQKYIDVGRKVNVDFFPEFVSCVFYNHDSPLHDGGMIIRNLKIISLSSYLYMTDRIVDVQYGARHRAAFGICEKYDCFAFVVSETNGRITCVHKHEIKQLPQNPEEMVGQITKIFANHSVYKNQFKK